MSNVLDNNDKQQKILALGRLGWTLRRIQQATAVRRETVSAYLKAAGIPVRGRGGRLATKTGHRAGGWTNSLSQSASKSFEISVSEYYYARCRVSRQATHRVVRASASR